MFSLGCVLPEIVTLHDRGLLQHIRENRSADPSFHANLGKVDTWLRQSVQPTSSLQNQLHFEIGEMLLKDPTKRPVSEDTLIRLFRSDTDDGPLSSPLIFGKCCATAMASARQHQRTIEQLKQFTVETDKTPENLSTPRTISKRGGTNYVQDVYSHEAEYCEVITKYYTDG